MRKDHVFFTRAHSENTVAAVTGAMKTPNSIKQVK